MSKIGYFIPAYRKIMSSKPWAMSMADLRWAESNGHEMLPWSQDGHCVDIQRNKAVQFAIDSGCDYLFMVDSDISAAGSPLKRLYNTMKQKRCQVTAALVICRSKKPNADPAKGDAVYQVKSVGTGIILIDVKWLQKNVPKPWFSMQVAPDGMSLELGEDIFFSQKVRKHGGKIYVNSTFATIHQCEYDLMYNPENWNAADE